MLKNLKKNIDLRLIGIISLVYLAFVVIYASKNAYLRFYRGNLHDFNWGEFIFGNILDWLLIIIFMMFIAYTTKILMNKNIKWVIIIIIHLFFSFLIGAFTLGISQIINGIGKESAMKWTFEDFILSYIRLIDLHFLIYVALATIIYVYYYFEKVQESKIQTSKLQEQLSKSRLKFLQSQMNPHFLFNTLNGIHSLIDIDTNKSKSMLLDLSDILRTVLDKKDQNLIELQDELILLKKYIHINKTRFSDQLQFHIDIENDLENVLVPNMLIQPIVENAIKHGYSKDNISLKIKINIYKKEDYLIIKVENNGRPITDENSILLNKGTGLHNINERLKTLYKNSYELNINNVNNQVVTKVKIPIRLSISEIKKDF